MSVPFYMDEHVHGAITSALRQRGIDVLTAQEDGMTGVDDDVLLDRAATLGRVLVSNDTDFLIIGTNRQRAGDFFAGIIYAPQNNALLGTYIEQLETIAAASASSEYLNRVFNLPF